MENNYPRAYKEVIEILKYVPQESVDKIPQTMIDTFKAKMDNTYKFWRPRIIGGNKGNIS